jgi:hypothetical protein
MFEFALGAAAGGAAVWFGKPYMQGAYSKAMSAYAFTKAVVAKVKGWL